MLIISICLHRCLVKVIGEHDNNWDEYIDPVLFSIRSSIQESTRFTPFFLMYGREARLPLEAEKSCVIADPSQLADVQQTIDRLSRVRENIFPTALKNIESSQSKQKEQYRKRKGLQKKGIHVGDTVLRLNMLKRTKRIQDGGYMAWTTQGAEDYRPWLLSPQVYQDWSDMKRKVNIGQLKLYHELQKVDDKVVSSKTEA